MTSNLRASSLATFAATVLAFGSPQGAFADGRGDWKDYAWQAIDVADCHPVDGRLVCPAYHQKWDWKRNQWVDIVVSIDPGAQRLYLSQQLTDNDKHDDDYVCVTALIVDARGTDIIAHHQNWHMMHGEVVQEDFAYSSNRLSDATQIHIGSKQCREGAGQDDDVYSAVLAGIPR